MSHKKLCRLAPSTTVAGLYSDWKLTRKDSNGIKKTILTQENICTSSQKKSVRFRDSPQSTISDVEVDQLNLSDESSDLDSIKISVDKTQQSTSVVRGMFTYNKNKRMEILRTLICHLHPEVSQSLHSCLPAHIVFMFLRYWDFINDVQEATDLVNNSLRCIKAVVKQAHSTGDLQLLALWLANCCKLIQLLKQYSGEEKFQKKNTAYQNSQILRNLDMSDFRTILSDYCVVIYKEIICLIEDNIKSYIVSGILEHEILPGQRSSLRRTRSATVTPKMKAQEAKQQRALDTLLKKLTNIKANLSAQRVNKELVSQIFKQVFHYICSIAFNTLLTRGNMCHRSRGDLIKFSISNIEHWCRENDLLLETCCLDIFQPLIQVSEILAIPKTKTGLIEICTSCDRLLTDQIVNILSQYLPLEDDEDCIPLSVIRIIEKLLSGRQDLYGTKAPLLMDPNFALPLTIPFKPSRVNFQNINIPDILYLATIRKL